MTEHLENQERFSIDELVSLCHVQQIQLINGLPSKDEITELIKLAADENSDPNCVSIEVKFVFTTLSLHIHFTHFFF